METSPTAWNPDELTAHAEWIRGLALQLVRDAARADDLVQETYLAALERRPETGRSLKPWLRRVLQKRFAFGVRCDARRRSREVAGAVEEALPPSDALVESAEAHARLVQELTRLREPYRTALLLRYFEGKSPQEIAERQGVPAATVRSHLKRGLDDLRERLDRRDGGGRRTWALALIPLAAASRDAKLAGGLLSTLTHGVRAMNPLTQTLVGSTVLLAAAAFVARQIDLAPPGGLDVGLIGGGGTPAVHATAAEEFNSASQAHPVTPGPSGPAKTAGGSSTADSNARESIAPDSTWLAFTPEDERVTGVVVDKDSGAPVPSYSLELQAFTLDDDSHVVLEGEPESLVTGDDGSFETVRTYAEGTRLMVRMTNGPGMGRLERSKNPTYSTGSSLTCGLTWNPENAPVQLQTRVGPTYTLALTAPFDWHSTKLTAYLGVSEEEPYGVLESCELLSATVLGSSAPFVRFQNTNSSLPTDRPWILHLETSDGLFGADVPVPAGNGIHEGVVPVVIQPTAKLSVNLVSDHGVSSSTVVAQAVNGTTRRVLLGGAQEQRPDGRFQCCRVLLGIPPGEYDLLITCDDVEPIEETVTLLPGEAFWHDVEIEPAPAVSYVRGELHSVSGQYGHPCMIVLYQPGSRGDAKWTQPHWAEHDGEWIAPFELNGLAEGEYVLELQSSVDYYRWTPLPETVTPPNEELILTCHDTDPVRTIEFRPTDANSGEAIGGAYAHLTVPGCAQAGAGSGRTFSKVPTDASFTWWLTAPGYVPRWGDETAISGHETLDDEQLDLIEVGMEPGWGARIEATQIPSREPLEGLEVIVDDVLVGVTDGEGKYELIRDTPPASVELRKAGWRFVTGSSYDSEQHTLSDVVPDHHVYFEPEP